MPEGKAASLTQVNSFNPESFERGVTILAIRWLHDPPEGLPKRQARQVEPHEWVVTAEEAVDEEEVSGEPEVVVPEPESEPVSGEDLAPTPVEGDVGSVQGDVIEIQPVEGLPEPDQALPADPAPAAPEEPAPLEPPGETEAPEQPAPLEPPEETEEPEQPEPSEDSEESVEEILPGEVEAP
ncbi:MAG: hypothetical protein GWO24_10715 [Akkermansiaceae bacterium]|nr:hypothetical protein [Akkermansiaceae bacterium]